MGKGDLVMTSKKLLLSDVFSSISDPIKAILSGSKKSILHPGTKGDASEYQWSVWLKTYLPKRYEVDKGFVIDYKGNISEQQDIIIYDRQYSPYLLNRHGVIYVPAESVYAVIEVKQKMTKNYIIYAGKKVSSVRSLKRTSKEIVHAGGKFKSKKPHKIIGGIVTLENTWKDPLGKSLFSTLKALKKNEQIDIGCSLDKDAAFFVEYSNEITIKKSKKHHALTFFFITLVSKLQDIGTVPAIDFQKYLETINVTKNK